MSFTFRISLMDSNVAKKLESGAAKKYMSMLLLGYGTDMNYLEIRISQFHSDIHHLIQKMKTFHLIVKSVLCHFKNPGTSSVPIPDGTTFIPVYLLVTRAKPHFSHQSS